MSLSEDFTKAVQKIFRETWTTRKGRKVPESNEIALGNEAVELEGTVLYADLDDSTNLVDRYKPEFAAEIYKAYLSCAARVIRSKGGEITAYDGDRIMAVYIGDSKNSSAAESALKINYTVTKIINPLIKKHYPTTSYRVKQVVGIDSSELFIARTGIRGSNDLVWVGRSANYAAKLCSLSPEYPSRITETVYNKLNESAKYSNDGRLMWEIDTSNNMNGINIYRSNWWWEI